MVPGPGAVLILSGTHAKATNMICLTQDSVSIQVSELCRLDPWAITVTGQPRFSLSHSDLDRSWQGTKLHFKSPTAERRHVLWQVLANYEA